MSAIVVSEEAGLGMDFVAALALRDFEGLQATLADEVCFRALLPTDVLELEGSEAVAARFERWLGSGGELELLDARAEAFADRLRVGYRLRLEDHPFRPGSGPQLLEQQLVCRAEDDRIAAVDLLCTGFRPDETS